MWVCPPRRPQRNGVVEKAIQYVTRSWWRTAPVSTLGHAQADVDRWAGAVADRRTRRGLTIADLAGQEGLLGLPARAFPAQLEAQRVVGRSALVAFEGNHYTVLQIDGDSYRMRNHRARLQTLRAGLNHPTEGGECSRSQLPGEAGATTSTAG